MVLARPVAQAVRHKLEEDVTTIKPQHIVVAGIIGGVLFVLVLMLIVRLIVANA